MEVSRQMKTVPLQHERSTVSDLQNADVVSEEGRQTPKPRLSLEHYLHEAIEAILALGIVSVAGTFFPSIWLQSHLLFCMFFLVIFVIAIRSHVVTTYIVGFLVAGYYSLLLWLQTNPSFVMPQIFVESFLLFVSGIVISERLRARQQQIELAEQHYAQKAALLAEMTQCCQATQALNAELGRQCTERVVSVSAVSKKIARLWRLQGQERDNAIVDIVMSTLNAKFSALYLLRNGRMNFCASQKRENSKHTNPVRLNLDVKDALISRTLQSRQVCTIHDVLDDNRSTQQVIAMMAGPLVDHRNEIVGIVIVDDIPLLKFLPATVHLFGSLLQMISIAMHTGTPVTDGVLDISVPFLPGTEVKAVQTAILATNKDVIKDNRVTQLPGFLHLPEMQDLQSGRRLRFFARKQ